MIEAERAFHALGDVQLDTQKSEEKSRQFKRSIYVVKDIEEGEKFTPENIRVIRPGDGLHPGIMRRYLVEKQVKVLEKGRQ